MANKRGQRYVEQILETGAIVLTVEEGCKSKGSGREGERENDCEKMIMSSKEGTWCAASAAALPAV